MLIVRLNGLVCIWDLLLLLISWNRRMKRLHTPTPFKNCFIVLGWSIICRLKTLIRSFQFAIAFWDLQAIQRMENIEDSGFLSTDQKNKNRWLDPVRTWSLGAIGDLTITFIVVIIVIYCEYYFPYYTSWCVSIYAKCIICSNKTKITLLAYWQTV